MDISQFKRAQMILKTLGLDEDVKVTLAELLDIVKEVRQANINILAVKMVATKSGLVFQDVEKGYFIFYNPSYPGIDLHYVIAHEVSHILLNHVAKIQLPPSFQASLTNILNNSRTGHVLYRTAALERDPSPEQQAELLGSLLSQRLITENERQLFQALDSWGLDLR